MHPETAAMLVIVLCSAGAFAALPWGEFRSAIASKVGALSALGFLGALGFIPGWERLFGFMGFFGLIGLAYTIDAFVRFRRARRAPTDAGCLSSAPWWLGAGFCSLALGVAVVVLAVYLHA
jgi:hypothetical protein